MLLNINIQRILGEHLNQEYSLLKFTEEILKTFWEEIHLKSNCSLLNNAVWLGRDASEILLIQI